MKLRYGTPDEAGMSPERLAQVARLAEGWVRDGTHPALVVMVARRGVIVLHEAFGRLTPEPDSPPLARDSIFPIASLTKPITATLVMQLVEDGVFGLNRPVQDYIPEFVGEGKDNVMVHHLITHTSGLNEDHLLAYLASKQGTSLEELTGMMVAGGVQEYLRLRYDAPLWKPPSVEMSYCTLNYELLGEIVRRVSGRPVEAFAEERIFRPLGMYDTYYVVPDAIAARIAMRPADSYAAMLNAREFQTEPWASAGVYSTALDLAVFGQMFLSRGCYGGMQILSPASVAEMTRNQIPGISAAFLGEFFPEASWGYGWDVHGNKKALRDGSLYSPNAYAHSGAGGIQLWIDPVYELVGVFFSVVLEMQAGPRTKSCADLFMNAVTAAVMDE